MNDRGDNLTNIKDFMLALLSEGKSIRIKAHGYSMYPCIRPGSLMVIEPLKSGGLPVPGEIIAIRTENGFIIHRLYRIIKTDGIEHYITRGDSNTFADDPVTIKNIAGRITGTVTPDEDPVDTEINTRPHYILNRIRVIILLKWMKLRRLMGIFIPFRTSRRDNGSAI
jgi:signal peptidase I